MSWHPGTITHVDTEISKNYDRITLEGKMVTWVLKSLRLSPGGSKQDSVYSTSALRSLTWSERNPSIPSDLHFDRKSPVCSTRSLVISPYGPVDLLSEPTIFISVILILEKINSQHQWLDPLTVSFLCKSPKKVFLIGRWL